MAQTCVRLKLCFARNCRPKLIGQIDFRHHSASDDDIVRLLEQLWTKSVPLKELKVAGNGRKRDAGSRNPDIAKMVEKIGNLVVV
jgi:hypothetical protein